MSILKQVLSESLGSIFRRSSAENSLSPAAKTQEAGESADALRRPTASRASPSGMKVVILNWKAGENDPFTVVNAAIREHLRACGKNVEVIEITEDDWPAQVAELVSAGIEFAFTWQGLGSNTVVDERGKSFWEHLKIPLICIHGDHPSHMPLNHQLESPYCFHLYANADAARYSNRHFRRIRSASVIDIPKVHREQKLERRAGDYFVVAKNITDPLITESLWRAGLNKATLDTYMMAAETLRSKVASESYVEIHDVLDDLIAQHNLEWLSPSTNITAYHQYHSDLDHYLRSHKTVAAVAALREFPVRVYGRGWERIAQSAPASHVFEAGRNMADSQDLYYTRFGLVDVSPSKGLHDRTRRAMVNGGGFLSSANLADTFADIERFEALFFSFRPKELPEKCAAAMRNPDAHIALGQQFAHTYHDRFHFRDFVNRLDYLAKSISRF